MGTVDGEELTGPSNDSSTRAAAQLNAVFGKVRAEYFREEVFDLFTHPSYFPQLQTIQPCLLVGGRGTGKTTVLRCLSYEGQAHLNASVPMDEWPAIGMYWRIDTSVVRAFEGPELTDRQWDRLFTHYLNLTLTGLILEFVEWAESKSSLPVVVSPQRIKETALSIGLRPVTTSEELRDGLSEQLLALEIAVNNLDPDNLPPGSSLGRPVQRLIQALAADPNLAGKTYFFLIDEYENLTDRQQRIVNTLVKHAGDYPYTFKIGMRETGHREHATINPDEHLIAPADYAYIDITERLDDASFVTFARQVCESRLRKLQNDEVRVLGAVNELFPSLSEEAEAKKLGVDGKNASTRRELARLGAGNDLLQAFDALSPLAAYLVQYWSDSQEIGLLESLNDAIDDQSRWNTRLNNYQHAMLYTIRRGKRGYRKYYCGWSSYAKMANGNIRYLLQLVHEALQRQLIAKKSLASPLSPEVQTDAASTIGERVVRELQGLSSNGSDLTRLVLGLGRVFQVMAAQPEGHTPEVSQFRLNSAPETEVEELLNTSVMHLAVRRFTTDKMAAVSGQIKDYSYQLHPIFSPFFTYSYRSKRRMDISPSDILGLVHDHKNAIPRILHKSNRSPEEELPSQLMMFREYFDDAN
ncbi:MULTISPECIES: hypothetical protein [unclassified Mycobacterium]|uniref:ORC-CDC6 family AAA ATPase n=1 Tax=unclassified Mycobacterium TaxID=2642494 RepID=UPI00089AA31A|nr:MULTISPECIES: hypothetical protein [unclassified Mycobacterium]SEB25881.1 hypothetical protein SAMN04488580_11845 [Mycobacterium sp. 283mftsu]